MRSSWYLISPGLLLSNLWPNAVRCSCRRLSLLRSDGGRSWPPFRRKPCSLSERKTKRLRPLVLISLSESLFIHARSIYNQPADTPQEVCGDRAGVQIQFSMSLDNPLSTGLHCIPVV